MPQVSYNATLAYYDSAWYSGEAAQGCYGKLLRTGVLYFAGMNLKGKTINSVSLTAISRAAGANAGKTAFFYRSGAQGINTSLTGAQHKTGSMVGSISGQFYNNTLTRSVNFLRSFIAAGENTFCIYATDTLTSSWSANYFKWSKVTLMIDYSTPTVTPDYPTAPVSITPAYGTLGYYHAVTPTVLWSGATGGAGYIIERAVNQTSPVLDTWAQAAQITGGSYKDSALVMPLGGYVRYRVKTISPSSESGYIYTGNIRRMLPNTAPANVTATADQTKVSLSWEGETADFLHYSAEYQVDGGEWKFLDYTQGNECMHEISDIPMNSTLTYRVRREQTSVDAELTVLSDYSLSNTVQKHGGVWIQTENGAKKGLVWHRRSGRARQARRVFCKSAGNWKESV